MRLVKFDPLAHPRNRLGLFIETLKSLEPGDSLRMPGGVTVAARKNEIGRTSYRVTSPLAGVQASDTSQPKRAAETALSRQARVPHSATIGGEEPTTYSAYRRDELAARAKDPLWSTVAPEDFDDLLARPTHGSPRENLERLDDWISQAEAEQDEINDRVRPMDPQTGARDYAPGDEDRAAELDELLPKAKAAFQALEDMPEAEFERRSDAWASIGDRPGGWMPANHSDVAPPGTVARWTEWDGDRPTLVTGTVVRTDIDPDGSTYTVRREDGTEQTIALGDTDRELEVIADWPPADGWVAKFRAITRPR